MSVATSEKKAEKMIEIFRSIGVTVEEVIVTEKGDESKLIVPRFHLSHTRTCFYRMALKI